MPPSVHCADVLTSTGNHTPCGRSHALSASSTTPGSTVTVCASRVVVEHAVEVLAVVDDQRRADRLPALRAARAPRQQRHAELAAHLERGAHVVVAARHQHADRHAPGRSTRRWRSGRATRGRTAPRPATARAQALAEARRRRAADGSAAAASTWRVHAACGVRRGASRRAPRRPSPAGARAGCAASAGRRAPRARSTIRSCSRAALAHLSSSKLERKRRFWMRRLSVA